MGQREGGDEKRENGGSREQVRMASLSGQESSLCRGPEAELWCCASGGREGRGGAG